MPAGSDVAKFIINVVVAGLASADVVAAAIATLVFLAWVIVDVKPLVFNSEIPVFVPLANYIFGTKNVVAGFDYDIFNICSDRTVNREVVAQGCRTSGSP